MKPPKWWPECPYPEEIFPMKLDQYAEFVPNDGKRTALSGMLGRQFWGIASRSILEAYKTHITSVIDGYHTFCPECGFGVEVDEDGCCSSCGATAVGDAVKKYFDELALELK